MKKLIKKVGQVFIFVALIVMTVFGSSRFVIAQDAPSSKSTTEERLEVLDQKIRILERKEEIEQEKNTALVKETPVLSADKGGFSLKSSDGGFQIKFRGDLQADGRFFISDDANPISNNFLIRRARPVIEGTLAKYYGFKIQTDFGQGSTVLQDAYLDINYWAGKARLKVGKYKAPFGLERLQSSTETLFAELALPSSLTPNYDVGVQLHGELLDGLINYAAGVFNGVSDGGSSDSDTSDGKDYIGRIFTHPFKKSDLSILEGLGIGVAYSSGDRNGTTSATNLPSYKTAGQQTFFTYRTNASPSSSNTTIAYGDNQRFSPQVYWYLDSLGILGEYISSSQKVKIGSTHKKLTNEGWQIAASYVLTGEKTSYKGVTPKGEWGALEIAARYSKLAIDAASFPVYADITKAARSANAVALGLNWYLDKNVKLVIDYEQTKFNGGSTGNRETEKIIFSRFQFVF